MKNSLSAFMHRLYSACIGLCNSEHLGIDSKIILEWIHLAQDRDQWQALVSTLMNLCVP
jgi:hypothetical protein